MREIPVAVRRHVDTDWTVVMQIVDHGVADLKEFARWAATPALDAPTG